MGLARVAPAGRGHCVSSPPAAHGVGGPLGGAAPRVLVQEELHTVVGAQQSLDPYPQEAKAAGRGRQGGVERGDGLPEVLGEVGGSDQGA